MRTKIASFFKSDPRILKVFIILYLFAISFIICMQSPLNPFKVQLASVDSSVFHYVASIMKNGGLMYRDTFDHKGPLLYFINYLGLYISYYSGAWFIEILFSTVIIQYFTARLFCNKFVSCCSVLISYTALLLSSMSGNDYTYYRISLVPAYIIPIAAFGSQIKLEKKNFLTLEVIFIVLCSMLTQKWLTPTKETLAKIINHTSEVDFGDEHHRELFSLIETYTDKDEPITVYGNENAFYFYSQRFSASKYSFTYPIILIDEEIRKEYFQELHETLPKLILVQTLWCNDEYIQEFLSTHPYECITDFYDYDLYLRTTENTQE